MRMKPKRFRGINEIDIDEFKRIYYDYSHNVDYVYKALKVSKTMLLKFRRKHNLPSRHNLPTRLVSKRIEIEEGKLRDLYNKGLSTIELAKKFKCSDSTIKNRMNEYGIKPNMNGKLNHEDRNEIKKLYEDGLSSNEIAKIYNVDQSSIYRALKKSRVTIKTRSVIDINKEMLEDLYNKGLTMIELSKEFKCSVLTIRNRMKKYGIKSNRRCGRKKDTEYCGRDEK